MLPDFRIRQRDYLLEIAQALTSELDLDTLLTRIVRFAVEMLAGQAGLIILRAENGHWAIASVYGIPSGFVRYLNTHLGNVTPADGDVQHELNEINALLQGLTSTASLGLLTGVGLPLVIFQRVIGVIFIFRGYAGSFSANDRALLQSFATQAAIAVHNAQLYTQISQEKQRVDALLDTIADGILILTPDQSVERVNPAFLRMFAVEREKVIGRQHRQVISWVRRQHGQTLEQASAGGWPLNPQATLYVEGDVRRFDGSLLPVGITYASLFSADNRLLHIIASVRDITHFRQAEELKSTFISVISHELKTPVALIKGYVATLRRDDVQWDSAIVQDSLQVIEEESDRLTELIENLLEASRLQAGGLQLHFSEVSLASLARRMAERLQTQTEKHHIVVDFPPDFPIVLGDESRLMQVFSNLISNAIKYAISGGEIRIQGDLQEDALDGLRAVICVTDQGPGIAPGDAPHVFDRFYRADEASRLTKGAGLGLYLTRAIIEAHGGRIWVDTRYRHGARICFSLPLDAPAQP
ncbi:MAG: ATP-binding protein [Anaerolineales bacterium]